MITKKSVNYSSFMDAVNSLNNVECYNSIEGCLLDSVLYIGNNKNGVEIAIAGIETYLNSNSSCYTVKIAITDKDKEKLYALFYDLEQQT